MDLQKKVALKVKRYDLHDDPEVIETSLEFNPDMDAESVLNILYKICNVSRHTTVLKLRNSKEFLIPISYLIENAEEEPFYIIDVASISCFNKSNNGLLQDAYVDAICNKVKSLELRIAQTELLLPQLEWRRQVYMEDTVSGLLNKCQFLNKRFDDLTSKLSRESRVET